MSEQFGRTAGPFWWGYDLTAGAVLSRAAGFELRWFGIVLPWFAVGVTYRRPTRTERSPR